MTLTPADILVVYREGDSDSIACAQHYKALRGLDDDQLLAIACNSAEVLADYATFTSQVETAVKSEVVSRNAKAIVVCKGVPGGFNSGIHVVSTTSRLSRCLHTFARNTPNPLFNRRDLTRLDDEHFDAALVCSRIDAPTLAQAKQFIDNAARVVKQGAVNGKFYLDPFPYQAYSDSDPEIDEYAEELNEFRLRTLPSLNLAFEVTATPMPGHDSVIPFAQGDSFVWAAGADSASDSFFRDSLTSRVFLYNAGSNAASTVRDPDGNGWPILAIRNGYAATAGSMSEIAADHYLRPRPFFHALMAGGTIGEAFLVAVPFLDSPETLFGDPMVTVGFPANVAPPVTLDVKTATMMILDRMADAGACVSRREKLADEVRRAIHASEDTETTVELLYPAQNLFLSLAESQSDGVRPLVVPALGLLPERAGESATPDDLAALLDEKSATVPKLLADAYNAVGFAVASEYVSPSGGWSIDFPLAAVTDDAVAYHFELQGATDEFFDSVTITKDSAASQTGWTYQKEIDAYEALPAAGVPSAFTGRVIRISGTGATTGNAIYFRFRQKVGSTKYGWVTKKLVVSA